MRSTLVVQMFAGHAVKSDIFRRDVHSALPSLRKIPARKKHSRRLPGVSEFPNVSSKEEFLLLNLAEHN